MAAPMAKEMVRFRGVTDADDADSIWLRFRPFCNVICFSAHTLHTRRNMNNSVDTRRIRRGSGSIMSHSFGIEQGL